MDHRQKTAAHTVVLIVLFALLSGCDYTTQVPIGDDGVTQQEQALAYSVGAVNRPSPAQIAGWVGFVETFWSSHFSPPEVVGALGVQSVEFVDGEIIRLQGRDVRGYSTGRHAVVGVRRLADGSVDWSYVESLFKHELGHGVLGELGVAWDEQLHHQMFADLGYGY